MLIHNSTRTNGSILKKKKGLDQKSLGDVYEDNFIDEEARKHKRREKEERLTLLIEEKEKTKKLLQIEKAKEPNDSAKTVQNLNKRLTLHTLNEDTHSKQLRSFQINQKILAKIDRLDKNYNTPMSVDTLF